MSREMWAMAVGFGSGLVLGFVIHAFLVRPSPKKLKALEERNRMTPADFEPRRAANGWDE